MFNSPVFNSGVRLQRVLPVLATSVVLLAGCGVAGTQFSPGVAAEVGDQTISTKQLDEVTADFCAAAEADSEGEPGRVPQPLRSLAQRFVVVLINKAIVEQLAEDYDVEPSAEYTGYLAQLENELAELDDDQRAAAVEILGAQAYAEDVLPTIGGIELAKEDGGATEDADEQAAGQEVLEEWVADHDVKINPRYGIDFETGAPIDADLSYPAGETAQDGISQESQPGYAAALPDTQACLLPGPAAA